MILLLVFVASFSSVGLGCFQVVNVMRSRYLLAALTSLAQGVAVLTLYRIVPHVDTMAAGAGFLLGGVFGGQLSMHVTRRRAPMVHT